MELRLNSRTGGAERRADEPRLMDGLVIEAGRRQRRWFQTGRVSPPGSCEGRRGLFPGEGSRGLFPGEGISR